MTTSPAETLTDAPTVALLGAPASYHDVACDTLSPESGEARRLRYGDFPSIVRALADGEADRAVIAVANSRIGMLGDAFDAMGNHQPYITGEVLMRIRHNLLVSPEVTDLSQIRTVRSNAKAMGQCARRLQELQDAGIEIDPGGTDTATCAREVAEGGDPGIAAIAGRRAAELYGLHDLESDIQDRHDNQTRFWRLEREPREVPDSDTTSLLMTLPNHSGSLYDALGVWAARGVDLRAIESQPLDDPDDPWRVNFYIAARAGAHEEPMRESLEELRERHGADVEVLGSYKAGELIES